MDEFEELQREWLTHLRIEKGASPHTLSNYRRDLDRYRRNLHARGIRTPNAVGAHDVEKHLADFASGALTGTPAAASTVARAQAAIRSFHTFLSAEGATAHDPTAKLHSPKRRTRLPQSLTIDQVEALLHAAHLGEDVYALRNTALLEVLYASGARISEALALVIDDLDLDEDTPVIRLYGKGRKERIVPIGSMAKEALNAYLVRARPFLAHKGKGTPAVFLNSRGAPLSRQSAWEILQKVAEVAGLRSHVSPHTLRHSFATHLLEGGASVRDVQELLGHASVQTTQIYTKVTATMLLEVYRASHPRALIQGDTPSQ